MDVPKAILWQQFGAALDILEKALLACPDTLWSDRSQKPDFWYLVYHTLFWLDLYLSRAVEAFPAPAPFTREPSDGDESLPKEPYTKDELKAYLEHGRKKGRAALALLADDMTHEPLQGIADNVSVFELLLYNTRHIQHHTG